MTKSEKKIIFLIFYFIAAVLPLLSGYFIYLAFSPGLPITAIFYELFPNADLSCFSENRFLKISKPYICDFMWAFAFTFSVSFVLNKTRLNYIKSCSVSFVFSLILELLQMSGIVSGTFDFADILFELLACITAAVIIKNFLRSIENEEID